MKEMAVGAGTARRAALLKRAGAAGFLFFLVKGLLWLALGVGVYLL
jgi:hypothetical protein